MRAASAQRARLPARTALVLLGLSLVGLACLERRLWEADFNTAASLFVRNGEPGKVISALLDVDRAEAPQISRIAFASGGPPPLPRSSPAPPHVVGRPDPRAPPR